MEVYSCENEPEFKPIKFTIELKNKEEAKLFYCLFNNADIKKIFQTRKIFYFLDDNYPDLYDGKLFKLKREELKKSILYDRRLFIKNLNRLKKEINS